MKPVIFYKEPGYVKIIRKLYLQANTLIRLNV